MLTVRELANRAGFIGDQLDNTVIGTSFETALTNLVKLVSDEIEKAPLIEETVKIWTVRNNTDLTEGRGSMYVQYVCECKSTAIRLAKRAGIQGCDAEVSPSLAYRINKQWYVPGRIASPSTEDMKEEKRIKDEEEKQRAKLEVIEKARSLGLSEAELKLLRD